MKHSLLLALSLVAIVLAGCSSTPLHVDTGAIHATTFSFVSRRGDASFADNREQIHQLIQDDITQNLAAKGLRKVDSGGDVIVAYLVVVGNSGMTESISTYFGYGRNVTALHDELHDAYAGSKNPNNFKAGTLLIDIVDAKTFELLRRDYVTRPVLSNPAAEVRAANIQEAVDATLKDVRISH